jgi:hypothetical protein
MANRIVYPSSLFPLRGDLSAESGATTVEVIGLQNVPMAANPLVNGFVPTYNSANADIEWEASGGGTAVSINGKIVSSDFLFLVNTAFTINFSGDSFLGVRINGVRDGG